MAQIDTVDRVAQRPDGTWEVIARIERVDWDDTNLVYCLREKFDTLAVYALDGEMERQHPGSSRAPIALVLETAEPCLLGIRELLDTFRGEAEVDELEFIVREPEQPEQPATASG